MSKKWYKLDNAALIFPSIMRKNWSNAFRISVTMRDEIDKAILAWALSDLMKRFPTFFVRLRRGLFWYYLEEIPAPPPIIEDYAYPLTVMSEHELSRCAFRVLVFGNRFAVEIFHSVTDGSGGAIFVANLAARYLELRYGLSLERVDRLIDLNEAPSAEEIEDSFVRFRGKYIYSPNEGRSFKIRGEREKKCFHHLITGIADAGKLREMAHAYGATVNSFLGAVMLESLIAVQNEQVKERNQREVCVSVPVNLRKIFGSKTHRNFVLAVNVPVNPKYGPYTLEELVNIFSRRVTEETTKGKMAGRIAENVVPAENPLIRLAPLPIKKAVMRFVYSLRGERPSSINISNMGLVKFPENAYPYLERMEFIIGPQISYYNNCSVLTLNGKTYINMIRSIKETEIERVFFSRLVDLGLPIEIETNERS